MRRSHTLAFLVAAGLSLPPLWALLGVSLPVAAAGSTKLTSAESSKASPKGVPIQVTANQALTGKGGKAGLAVLVLQGQTLGIKAKATLRCGPKDAPVPGFPDAQLDVGLEQAFSVQPSPVACKLGLRADGYVPWERKVLLDPEQTTRVEVRLCRDVARKLGFRLGAPLNLSSADPIEFERGSDGLAAHAAVFGAFLSCPWCGQSLFGDPVGEARSRIWLRQLLRQVKKLPLDEQLDLAEQMGDWARRGGLAELLAPVVSNLQETLDQFGRTSESLASCKMTADPLERAGWGLMGYSCQSCWTGCAPGTGQGVEGFVARRILGDKLSVEHLRQLIARFDEASSRQEIEPEAQAGGPGLAH